MMRHKPEGFVVGVGGKGGARRPGLLAPDLAAIAVQDLVRFAAQDRDLVLREAVREKQIALFVEDLKLLGGKRHGVLPGWTTLAAAGEKITREGDRCGAVSTMRGQVGALGSVPPG